jgi:RNA ligase
VIDLPLRGPGDPRAPPHPTGYAQPLMSRHPARSLEFPALHAALEAHVQSGTVTVDRRGPLALYHYSSRCVYDVLWDDVSMLARGLILDVERGALVATPFPKFFNYGERDAKLPDEPFHAFEKLDGSLGIVFFHDGRWQVTTKGAFGAGQARWAEARLAQCDLGLLDPSSTYLFEIVYRDNRIVVHYDYEDLVLLGAYDGHGAEADAHDLAALAARLGTRVARRYEYAQVDEIVRAAEALDKNDEGFVIRFTSGYRIKLKGSAYRRVHALISRVTPLGLYDALHAGDDLDLLRREVPEEYWTDFDTIRRLLTAAISQLVDATEVEARRLAGLTDKEVGLSLQRGEIAELARPFLFACRKSPERWPHEPKSRLSLLRSVRPTGNQLAGYAPSTYILGLRDDV